MSLAFIWQDDYCIDNGIIDQEHLRLFKLANAVLAIERPSKNVLNVKKALRRFFEYTRYHFLDEEKCMLRIGYSQFEAHAIAHRQIIAIMNDMVRRCGNTEDYIPVLEHIMHDWIIRHITEIDKELGKYLHVRKESEYTVSKQNILQEVIENMPSLDIGLL